MKCPNCKINMEEGVIDEGFWTKRTGIFKAAQKLGKKFGLIKVKPVVAYFCNSCGKIELYGELEK